MIQVIINDCGKKFRQKWVFRNLNYSFEPGKRYAITGKNGSGKSTLIKIIAAYITPTRGNVIRKLNGNTLTNDNVYLHLAMAAPYIESIEEFTLPELIRFQKKFKPFQSSLSEDDILKISELTDSQNKAIKFFSSGMKQRALLSIAILSSAPLLLLDEPCANLDADARKWYAQLLDQYGKDRTIIIASNHNEEEYPACQRIISL
jgi:ABC-type multidrug transport system ATPase subunit